MAFHSPFFRMRWRIATATARPRCSRSSRRFPAIYCFYISIHRDDILISDSRDSEFRHDEDGRPPAHHAYDIHYEYRRLFSRSGFAAQSLHLYCAPRAGMLFRSMPGDYYIHFDVNTSFLYRRQIMICRACAPAELYRAYTASNDDAGSRR